MKQYTKEELNEIRDKSFEMTIVYNDSLEQFKRNRSGIILREAIDNISMMDQTLAAREGNYESAWNSLRDYVMFTVNYYLRECELLQKGDTNGS